MKKIMIIGSILAVLAAALAVVGYAYAQTPEPVDPLCPNFVAGLCDGISRGTGQGTGPGGMMGDRWNKENSQPGGGSGIQGGRWSDAESSYGPGSKMGRGGQGSGLLHAYMLNAFAAEFGLTPEALQAELDNGKRIYDIAVENGYTDEQFSELMTTVRAAAIEQAVAAGDLTQEQADWMQQRHGNGFGRCPMSKP